jgi:phosphatidylglycerophosphate synthase
LTGLGLIRGVSVIAASGEPANDAISIDRVYRSKRFKRWIRGHRSNATLKSVIDINSAVDIEAASQFIYRERMLPVSTLINTPVALSLAKMLAKTKITPNHVSLLGAAFIASACAMIATGEWMFQIYAAVMIQIAWTLDLTDGTLARITRRTSKAGHWLDTVVDHFTMFAIPFSIAFGATVATGQLFWIAIGFIGVLSLALMRISTLLNPTENATTDHIAHPHIKSKVSTIIRAPFNIVFSLDLLPHVYFVGLISGGSRYLIVAMTALWFIYLVKYTHKQLSS